MACNVNQSAVSYEPFVEISLFSRLSSQWALCWNVEINLLFLNNFRHLFFCRVTNSGPVLFWIESLGCSKKYSAAVEQTCISDMLTSFSLTATDGPGHSYRPLPETSALPNVGECCKHAPYQIIKPPSLLAKGLRWKSFSTTKKHL